MDIILMILYAIIALSVLVFIHEGGHYLTARAFGVRVTEFMIGLPGPSIGFTWKGTRFGLTAIPLGGYARICGMGQGKQSPYLEKVLAYVYAHGTVNMEDVADALAITDEQAMRALDELVEWGSIAAPTKKDAFNTYRTPAVKGEYLEGDARPVDDAHVFYEQEYRQQYCSLPFWKRSVILLAGITINILFAIVLFIVAFSLFGVYVSHPDTGEMVKGFLNPLQAIEVGFNYVGAVISAVIGLFNPATAAETVSNSSSIVGIAALSKEYADLGFSNFLLFMAMISVSLGIMNLLPIPPLDGGRFIVEVVQKISKRVVPERVVNYIATAGMVLIFGFFLLMLNQDIQRFVFGNW